MDMETEEVAASELAAAEHESPSKKLAAGKKEVTTVRGGDEDDVAMETEAVLEAEGEAEEDEFGLVESALDSRLRPVMPACDTDGMENEADEGEEGQPGMAEDIKLEVEEHDLADEADEAEADEEEDEEDDDESPRASAHSSAGEYSRMYKTTSRDRRSRIGSPGSAAAAATTKVSMSPGTVAGRGVRGVAGARPRGVLRGGRGGLPMVSLVRGGVRGSPVARGTPGRGAVQRPARGIGRGVFEQPSEKLHRIHIVDLTNCYVDLVKDKLVIKRKNNDDVGGTVTTVIPMALSFMDLVRIKEAVSKLLERANSTGPPSLAGRLRTARREAICWVEARLKKDAAIADMDSGVQTAPHGRQGQSKYTVVEAPPAARPSPGFSGPARVVTSTPRAGAGRGRGTPVQVTRPQTAMHTPQKDGLFRFSEKTPLQTQKTGATGAQKAPAGRPGDSASSRLVQAKVKNPKTSRDIVILQAKLRDLENVGTELRRAVDYFNLEAQKERTKVTRLKDEFNTLTDKLAVMEESLVNKANPLLMSLIDKDRRKLLTAHDEVLLECGELLAEVGRENYAYVLEQGLPLLSGRELEEKTRGVPMSWSLDAIELALAAAPPEVPSGGLVGHTARGRGRGRGSRGGRGGQRGRPRKVVSAAGGDVSLMTTTAKTSAAGAQTPSKRGQDGAAAQVDSSEHISLPQEVLEQVMNGKGYLVDENGERLEIRMVGDNPVIAGAQ